MRRLARLAAINLVVVACLLFLLDLGALLGLKLYDRVRPIDHANAHLLPNYQELDWAETHFREYARIQSRYDAFWGWRHQPFAGQTITIDQAGRRASPAAGATPGEGAVWFFGGSTMWGVGVDDANTIPTHFARLQPDHPAVNEGAIGFNAHQELNLLITRLAAGGRPQAVVFYDGVNDILQKCHVTNDDPFGHSRELLIRTEMDRRRAWSDPPAHFLMEPTARLIETAGEVMQKLRHRLFGTKDGPPSFDCDQDADKAQAIARMLLIDWRIAHAESERHGAAFLAVLQPTAYDSRSRQDHLDLDPLWGAQYAAVYPHLIGLLEGEFADLGDVFLDLRNALDQDERFFIDWCHLSPNGNRIIAERIDQALRRQIALGPADG